MYALSQKEIFNNLPIIIFSKLLRNVSKSTVEYSVSDSGKL
jgi:hypothetical protein